MAGRRFRDIGPLRLIERRLFHRLALQEWTYGWTIEAQISAAFQGAALVEVPVRERPRLAGEQKVSKVNWRRTLSVGCQIVRAGWRTHCRCLKILREQIPAAVAPASVPTVAVEIADSR